MPNFEMPEVIGVETELINPDVFIADAKKYTQAGDFKMAEKAYISALSAARGTEDASRIVKLVKEEVVKVYTLWSEKSIASCDFPEAEKAILKLVKVTKNMGERARLIDLYIKWGQSLLVRDSNIKGALVSFIKAWKLSNEYGIDKPDILETICALMYRSKDKKLARAADKIAMSFDWMKSAHIINGFGKLVVALIAPIFAPFSIWMFIGSLLLLLPGWRCYAFNNRQDSKEIKKYVFITFISLAWGIYIIVATPTFKWEVATFWIIVLISIWVMLDAIKRFRKYFIYKNIKVDAVIDKVSKTLSKVPVNLTVVNKPTKSTSQDETKGTGYQNVLGKIVFHGTRLITQEILRNLRF